MAAIQAVFADYKRVKSRKVHQIIFEVPSEKWPEAYKVLGEPSIETTDWFGIAPMNISEPAQTPKEAGKNYAANAALLTKEPAFQRFMLEEHGSDSADTGVKIVCKIQSKSELNTNARAAECWRDLRSEYEAWMRG